MEELQGHVMMKRQVLKAKWRWLRVRREVRRSIAVELGAAGATVYCTGGTRRTQRSEMDRPETIEETAELVDQAGGKLIIWNRRKCRVAPAPEWIEKVLICSARRRKRNIE
jgi:hypothetical protein